jgi:hypothetical protein
MHITLRSLTGTAVNGTAIDMSGWDAVRFTIPHGIFGTNGTLDGLVQTSIDSGFSAPINVTNSNLTQITNANGVAIVDLYRPTNRYVRLQLTSQTNGVTAGATADQYQLVAFCASTERGRSDQGRPELEGAEMVATPPVDAGPHAQRCRRMARASAYPKKSSVLSRRWA